jgi:hypothetical protein
MKNTGNRRKSLLISYAIAVFAVAVALQVRMAMDPLLHGHQPYPLFFIAVVASSSVSVPTTPFVQP